MNRPRDCISCLVGSRINDLKEAGIMEEGYSALLNAISALLRKPRSEVFSLSFRVVSELSGNRDPYYEHKAKLNELAKELLERIKDIVDWNEAELLKLAAAANIFDTSVLGYSYDLKATKEQDLFEPPAIDDSRTINWKGIKKIAYVPDNSGEIIFDLFVASKLSSLGYEILLVLREDPYEIDATYSEVLRHLNGSIGAIRSKWNLPPLYKAHPSNDAWRAMLDSDIVISKGIANLEGYIDSGRWLENKAIFLLRAKCPVIARALGVPRKSPVILSERRAWEASNQILEK
ncbi:MAG: ARMT1-like domain-containing protein [Fervidicoccaceae archaeon]